MNIDAPINNHAHGFLGSLTSLVAVAVSFLPHIEAWLRISSLVFGTAAAIVSIFIMLEKRNIEKEKRNEKYRR